MKKILFLALFLILHGFQSRADVPVVNCKGWTLVVDSDPIKWNVRGEGFEVSFNLVRNDVGNYSGVGTKFFENNNIQLNIEVEAGNNGATWLHLNLDGTYLANGQFQSIGITTREVFDVKNGITFEPKEVLNNAELNTRIKTKLKKAVIPRYSLEEMLHLGLINDGDILYFGLTSCQVINRAK